MWSIYDLFIPELSSHSKPTESSERALVRILLEQVGCSADAGVGADSTADRQQRPGQIKVSINDIILLCDLPKTTRRRRSHDDRKRRHGVGIIRWRGSGARISSRTVSAELPWRGKMGGGDTIRWTWGQKTGSSFPPAGGEHLYVTIRS